MSKESYPGQHLEILAKQLVTLVINYGPPIGENYDEAEEQVYKALEEFLRSKPEIGFRSSS